MLADLLASINLNAAEVLSLLCITASCTQLVPTISRVLRRGSVGSLSFWPHLVEASWRAWFCVYLWVVVRQRRPLGQAPAQGWMAGHDGIDLFLYGDTILSCCIVWAMPRAALPSGRRSARRTADDEPDMNLYTTGISVLRNARACDA